MEQVSNISDAAGRHRNRMAARSRDGFAAVAEIGTIPSPRDPARKAKASESLLYFLTESGYFPNSTGLSPLSDSHRRVIARFEGSIKTGELDWNIVFRGFAKTTLAVNAALWAGLNGHAKFIPLFGATKQLGLDLIELLKAELEANELLAADYPEVCVPIAHLEGKSQRCASQTHNGALTGIEWKANRIVLPTITGSAASGFCAVGMGLTASLRGMVRALPDGTRQRPDWFIVDDPQTDSSAASPSQVAKRMGIIRKAICKLGGHQRAIGGVVNGTIIEPDDVMDQMRNHDQFPQWQGEVVKMVESWATAHESHWLGEYARILTGFDPAQPGDFERARAAATVFYESRRTEMDHGAVVAWGSCFNSDWEVSAIQHAYNMLILDGEDVFASECQSSPLKPAAEKDQIVSADILTKLSGYERGVVPPGATKLTAFVDVQEQSLWWVVCAWLPNYCGYVIDCGVWPDQKRLDASKSRLKTTLADAYPAMKNLETRLRAGLADLCDSIIARTWSDPDGVSHRIACALVDVGDGDVTVPVSSWLTSSKWSSIARPSKGLGIGPSDQPLGERKKGERELRRGLNWVEMRQQKVRGASMVQFDANWWKSFVSHRWRAASARPANDRSYRPAEPGALYLWGLDPHPLRTFVSHQMSEYTDRVTHERSGRSCDVWKQRPTHPDNEWFDCLVGCAVAADYTGGVSLRDAGLKTVVRHRRRPTRKATELII